MTRWLLLLLTACTSSAAPPVSGPTLASDPLPVTTACYQGTSSGAGQRARTIARRTVDPTARTIVEDVVHDDAGKSGTKSFHVVMTVDGAAFTMAEGAGGFTGTGTLVGEPWKWTAWSSTSQLPSAGLVVESRDELTATGMTAHKQIKKAGAVVASLVDELTTFDCEGWAAAVAQLAVPVLDDALCDRACRQFATLKYWAAGEPAIAALPANAQAAARRDKTAELAAKLDAGAPACIAQCRAANNVAQTACLAQATAIDQVSACEAK